MIFGWVIGILAAILGTTTAVLFKKGGKYNPPMPQNNPVEPQPIPEPAPAPEPTPAPITPSAPKYYWDTPQEAYHSVRVICDEMGMTFQEKEILSACIYQESGFRKSAVGKNAKSTDWGIVQVNDTPGWHIGPGLEFVSVNEVLTDPEKCVRWMVTMFKTGHQNAWASYSTEAYKQWLLPGSKMRQLAGN